MADATRLLLLLGPVQCTVAGRECYIRLARAFDTIARRVSPVSVVVYIISCRPQSHRCTPRSLQLCLLMETAAHARRLPLLLSRSLTITPTQKQSTFPRGATSLQSRPQSQRLPPGILTASRICQRLKKKASVYCKRYLTLRLSSMSFPCSCPSIQTRTRPDTFSLKSYHLGIYDCSESLRVSSPSAALRR